MRTTWPMVAFFLVSIILAAFLGYRLALRHNKSGWSTSGRADHQSGNANEAENPSVPGSSCVDFHDAGQHTGETACVSGRVLRVSTSRSQTTYLDFCPNYRDCPFSTVIFASDRTRFGNLNALNGREVEIQGRISVYNGRPEIVIRDPQQLHVVP